MYDNSKEVVFTRIPSRFTIALHILSCTDFFQGKVKVTSEFLASSINVNPVIVRNITRQLKGAGLIEVKRGLGGASIARPLSEITFLDDYKAVESTPDDELFHFHENPNPDCPVGRNIQAVLKTDLTKAREALEDALAGMTLEDLERDMKERVASEEDSGKK